MTSKIHVDPAAGKRGEGYETVRLFDWINKFEGMPLFSATR
jgi:hypothetical protein